MNAKKRAERKYESALKSAGISEDFLERKGRSGATQILSGGGGRDEESKSEASFNYDYDDYDDSPASDDDY